MARKLLKPAALLLLVILGLLLFDAIIVTDKERLERTLEEIREAIERADAAACAAFLSPDYSFDGLDAGGVTEVAEEIFRITGKMYVKELERAITISDNLAVVEGRILTRSTPDSLVPFSVISH